MENTPTTQRPSFLLGQKARRTPSHLRPATSPTAVAAEQGRPLLPQRQQQRGMTRTLRMIERVSQPDRTERDIPTFSGSIATARGAIGRRAQCMPMGSKGRPSSRESESQAARPCTPRATMRRRKRQRETWLPRNTRSAHHKEKGCTEGSATRKEDVGAEEPKTLRNRRIEKKLPFTAKDQIDRERTPQEMKQINPSFTSGFTRIVD